MASKTNVVKMTVSPAGVTKQDQGQPGKRLKELRLSKGLSLHALSKASGVSIGMLSQVERDLTNPSLRVLTRIREGLGASVAALFADEPAEPAEPEFVRRKNRRPRLKLGYFDKELLSTGMSQNLQFMILHIPPNGSSGEQPLSYPAEKGGLVLEGEIVLWVDKAEATLQEGDSFTFNSMLPHSFHNPTDRVARVLWIIGAVSVDRHL